MEVERERDGGKGKEERAQILRVLLVFSGGARALVLWYDRGLRRSFARTGRKASEEREKKRAERRRRRRNLFSVDSEASKKERESEGARFFVRSNYSQTGSRFLFANERMG